MADPLVHCISSPIGPLTITIDRMADHWCVTSLDIGTGSPNTGSPNPGPVDDKMPDKEPSDLLVALHDQIDDYFAGRLRRFTLPLEPASTAFQSRLRTAMAEIPFGETVSYGCLARMIGSSPRAIGMGCARNPLPLIIPCHRVLGRTHPGGYSGGQGLETKRTLLAHERRFC